jgi:lipopolysaccharide/colanic/teichoic acid biosynthesis glycosyltransferase
VQDATAGTSGVHTIRPGITDFATLHDCHKESILAGSPDPEATYVSVVLPEKFALQYQYIENMSFSTVVILICGTVSAMLRRSSGGTRGSDPRAGRRRGAQPGAARTTWTRRP